MSERVLITGAQGFLGRYLVADWLAADDEAVILGAGRSPPLQCTFTHPVSWSADNVIAAPLPAGMAETLRTTRYAYRSLDVLDDVALTRTFEDFQPSIVVHLAASLRDEAPGRLVRTNVGGVVSLIEAICRSGTPPNRILFGSSGAVYGSAANYDLPLQEEMACAPIDPYAATKRAAEELGAILSAGHGLPAIWARVFNPVGAGQNERHLCGWLGRQVAEIAEGLRPPSVSAGPLDTTRDYIDVRDVASALRILATRGEPGRAYNVASSHETSGAEILSLLIELGRITSPIHVDRLRPRRSDIERSFADVSRLAALGWKPQVALRYSLADVVSYYRNIIHRSRSSRNGDSISRNHLVER